MRLDHPVFRIVLDRNVNNFPKPLWGVLEHRRIDVESPVPAVFYQCLLIGPPVDEAANRNMPFVFPRLPEYFFQYFPGHVDEWIDPD